MLQGKDCSRGIAKVVAGGFAVPARDERTSTLAICAGLRNAELRGLRGRHVARSGLVWVAENVARQAETRVAQRLLGHATIGTTETYLGKPRIDDLQVAVRDVTYGLGLRTDVLGVPEKSEIPREATTGIEPV
ncbi:MAG TPA: hypothetical protein VGN69_00600 [Solirubrobacteraceae bacterium]|nr:hypothetical protein [Solirubrobacteraceae bacterium]